MAKAGKDALVFVLSAVEDFQAELEVQGKLLSALVKGHERLEKAAKRLATGLGGLADATNRRFAEHEDRLEALEGR